MRQTIVISLLLLSVAFSLLNVAPLTVDFLFWQVETQVAVAVIVAMGIGLIAGALLVLPWGVQQRKALKLANARVAALEKPPATSKPPAPAQTGTAARRPEE